MIGRRQEYVRELSLALDLLAMAMEAGLDFQQALERVIQFGPRGILYPELAECLRQISLGKTRLQALQAMYQRTGIRALRGLILAVHLSDTLGGNLVQTFQTQAQALKQERLALAEAKAQQIPVKLIFPLIFFIFPCVFLVIFAPILYRLAQMDLW